MPAVTGEALAESTFQILGVLLPGESLNAADGATFLSFLNDFLDEVGNRGEQNIPFISRERFDLVANQGGPDSRYTIGDGGDFDTERPSNQDSITAANLILTATSPEVRIPLGIYTDDAYDANALPSMSNRQPTGLYYNPTYQANLGSIFLWPVPDTSENDLELFIQKSVAQFADLSTTYYVPSAWPRMLQYNMAVNLQDLYGKQLKPNAVKIASNTLAAVKRANLRLSDQMNDANWSANRRTYFNIQTGS